MYTNFLGIKDATNENLNFEYDKFYKANGLLLKNASNEEKDRIKQDMKNKLYSLLENVKIDIDIVKKNFVDILLDKEACKYLWILYCKTENEENYIDKISNILKQENKVTRGGTNTYKITGWMVHTLYVYQILSYNIPLNIELVNYNGDKTNKQQLEEIHNIYNELDENAIFLLKIIGLIHDIGVIEDIKNHDILGPKYVEQVLKEIGVNQETLTRFNININLEDFIKISKTVIKYHTLITSLSGENNDTYIENEYKKLLSELPQKNYVKRIIAKILVLLSFADVIAVDEKIMHEEKYKRLIECYEFFEQINIGKKVERDREKVAVERICDMVGENKIQNLISKFDSILNKYNINKKQFTQDMYNIKSMKYTGPLMKTLNDVELTIKIFYVLFELIGKLEGKEELKKYTIFFIPDKHENEFVKYFKDNSFFECVEQIKNTNKNNVTYNGVNIVKGKDIEGKYIHIRIV